ncbi:MAG TPA: GNAT family N-acetyltransferase [Bacteroidota bacterium]|nr:GNAT family N-acetyltransferase [Bacteroidota bacterium]
MTKKQQKKKTGPERSRPSHPRPLVIRPVRSSDGKNFLALVDALADYEKLPRPDRASRARLLRDATGPRRRVDAYLALTDGAAVGYAILFETYSSFLARPTLYLEDIFILPAYRGSGIGRRLFAFCRGEARRRRCGRMEWVVLGWNRPAIRFYERLHARRMKEWLLYRITL